MTRFKELKRIEVAIKQKNPAALQWAMSYCRMRLHIATRNEHEKYWRQIEKEVMEAMGEAPNVSN